MDWFMVLLFVCIFLHIDDFSYNALVMMIARSKQWIIEIAWKRIEFLRFALFAFFFIFLFNRCFFMTFESLLRFITTQSYEITNNKIFQILNSTIFPLNGREKKNRKMCNGVAYHIRSSSRNTLRADCEL